MPESSELPEPRVCAVKHERYVFASLAESVSSANSGGMVTNVSKELSDIYCPEDCPGPETSIEIVQNKLLRQWITGEQSRNVQVIKCPFEDTPIIRKII